MKEKCKFLLPLIMAAASLVSCDRGIVGKPAPQDGMEPISFITMGGGFDYEIMTRSDLGTMMADGFGLFGYNTLSADFNPDSPSGLVIDNYRLVSRNGLDWEYADAVAYWNASSIDKYSFLAYHPYDETQGTTQLTLPSGPMKFDDCIDYVVSVPVINQTEKRTVTLDFSHIFSKLSTTVTLAAGFEGQEYKLVSAEFKDVRDYSSFSLADDDFDRSKADMHDIAAESSNIINPVLKNADDVITLDPIYISPYSYADMGEEFKVSFTFEYSFTNSEGVVTMNTFTRELSIKENLERNKAYNLNVRFAPDKEGGIGMNVRLDDYSVSENLTLSLHQTPPVDLSEGGRANCYIVEKAGKYCIDVRYKGNSLVETVGDAVSAEVLWESRTGEVSEGDLIGSIGLEDDKLLFTASDKKGNALVAVRDASGTILWSWHIWLTDRPSDQIYKNNAGTVMDRNLGAVSSVREDGEKTYGLYYQWGRKDPFVGLDAQVGPHVTYKSSAPVTSDRAIELPYCRFTKDGDNWLTPADMKRWDSNGDGSGNKTVNDPCPAGYRVPTGGRGGLWDTAVGGVTRYPTFDRTYIGCDFGADDSVMSLTDDPVCWYPAYGPMDYTAHLPNYGSSYYLSNICYNEYNMYTFYVGISYVSTTQGCGLSYSGNVRCVKE